LVQIVQFDLQGAKKISPFNPEFLFKKAFRVFFPLQGAETRVKGAKGRDARSTLTLLRTLRLGLRAAFTTFVAAFPVGSFVPQLFPSPPFSVLPCTLVLHLAPHGGRWKKREEGALRLSMTPKKRGAPPKETSEQSEPEQGEGGAKRSKQVRT
jgi:hypothetical protein